MKNLLSFRPLAILVMASTLALQARADDTYVAPVEDAFALAQQQYSEGRFGEAFGNYYWAAIRDHAQAQEIVGMMYLLGPGLYGPAVRADRVEAMFWLGEAGRRGREAARHMECAMRHADLRNRLVKRVAACFGGAQG